MGGLYRARLITMHEELATADIVAVLRMRGMQEWRAGSLDFNC